MHRDEIDIIHDELIELTKADKILWTDKDQTSTMLPGGFMVLLTHRPSAQFDIVRLPGEIKVGHFNSGALQGEIEFSTMRMRLKGQDDLKKVLAGMMAGAEA